MVKQCYITEKNRIIVLSRNHAEMSSVAKPGPLHLRQAVRLCPLRSSTPGQTPTSASSLLWPRRSSQPTSHRLQLQTHLRLQPQVHPRAASLNSPRVRSPRARLTAALRSCVHHQPANDRRHRRAAGRYDRRACGAGRHDYLLTCGNSGVKLLGIMYAACDKLNGTAELLILDDFNALTSRGLETTRPPLACRSTARSWSSSTTR